MRSRLRERWFVKLRLLRGRWSDWLTRSWCLHEMEGLSIDEVNFPKPVKCLVDNPDSGALNRKVLGLYKLV